MHVPICAHDAGRIHSMCMLLISMHNELAFRYQRWFDDHGKAPASQWNAHDIFDAVWQRDRLIQALAALRYSNKQERGDWAQLAVRDDAVAFDWLDTGDAVKLVLPAFRDDFKMWRALYMSGSRTGVVEYGSIPEDVHVQLERLVGVDARSIGMNFTNAEAALEERWFQEANDFDPDAQRCFNRICIYQGAGRHASDDRAFLKVLQSRVLEEDSVSAGLLEELQWIATSTLFDTDSFSCLVDTPGLDDTNPFRISQTRAAIKASSTVLMFSQVHFSYCFALFLSSPSILCNVSFTHVFSRHFPTISFKVSLGIQNNTMEYMQDYGLLTDMVARQVRFVPTVHLLYFHLSQEPLVHRLSQALCIDYLRHLGTCLLSDIIFNQIRIAY